MSIDEVKKADVRSMTMRELSNLVAGNLPDGWMIRVDLMLDSSNVELSDCDGEIIDYPSNHECLADEIRDALEFAMEYTP